MRYAIYFTPAQSTPLAEAAAEWLGRDADTGETLRHEDKDGLSAQIVADVTSLPRRYGFHATLKAPFRLAAGETEGGLVAAMEAFAAQTPAIAVPEIRVGNLSGFFALVLAQPYVPLDDFAASVVTAFEKFRAPLTEEEIARRNPDHLSPQETENLRDWGYPYVLDSFRFHMTLTNRVPIEERDALLAVLESRFTAVIPDPLSIDGLALFAEPEPGAPFIVRERVALSGASHQGERVA